MFRFGGILAAFIVSLALWNSLHAADSSQIPLSPPPESLPAPEDLVKWPLAPYPTFDATSVGNVGDWLFHKPAGKHGKISPATDGTFVFADGTPARFWGTTTVYAVTFPDTEDEIVKLAEAIAARGFNSVRFHHADSAYGGMSFLSGKPRSNFQLDPKTMDKLDRFAAELIKRGVYLYVGLIDYRPVLAGEGILEAFPDYDTKHMGWKGIFPHPAAVEAWKKAAKTLLDHTNPYTGRRWAEEPAVMMVEIINENGPFWDWGHQVPDSVHKWYDAAWNEWLLQKYGSREKLATAWTDANGICGLFDDEDPAKSTVYRPRMTNELQWDRPYRSRSRGVARLNDYYAHLADISRNFFVEAKKYLEELGYTGPAIGSHELRGPADRKALLATGTLAAHLYTRGLPVWHARPGSGGITLSGVDVQSNNWFSNFFRAKASGVPGVNGEWTGGTVTMRADANFAVAASSAFQRLAASAHFSYGHRWGGVKMTNFDNLYDYLHYLKRISITFSYSHEEPWMMVNRICAPLFIRADLQKPKYTAHIAYSAEDVHEQSIHSLGLTGGGGTIGGAANFLPMLHNVESHFFDKAYDGAADVVFMTGRTASGDYSKAKHAVLIGDNPWLEGHRKTRDIGAPARAVRPQVRVVNLKEKTVFRISTPWAQERELVYDSLEGAVEAASLPQGAQSLGLSTDGKYALGWLDDKYLVLPNGREFQNRIGDPQWLYRLYLLACRRWKIDTRDNSADTHYYRTDTGELLFDWAFSTIEIDSPNTQGASGIIGWRPENKTRDLEIKVQNPYAHVLLTSADGKPLREAERMLLVAAARMQNEGQENGPNQAGHYAVLKTGKAPVYVEALRGEVVLRSNLADKLAVYALDHEGKRRLRVPAQVQDGTLRIPLTPQNLTVWYEVSTQTAADIAVAESAASPAPEYPQAKLVPLADFLARLSRTTDGGKTGVESTLPEGMKQIRLLGFDSGKLPLSYGNIKLSAQEDLEYGRVLAVQFGKVNASDWHAGWWSNLSPLSGVKPESVKMLGLRFKGDGTLPREAYFHIQTPDGRYRSRVNLNKHFEDDSWQTLLFKPEDFVFDAETRKKREAEGKAVIELPDLGSVGRIDFVCIGPLMESKSDGYFAEIFAVIEAQEETAAAGDDLAEKLPPAEALKTRNVTIPIVAGIELQADGNISDGEWARATGFAIDEDNVPGWHFFGTHVIGGQRLSGEGGRIWLQALDKGLAVLALIDKGGAPLVAERTDWWQNDCVEIFTDVKNAGGKPDTQLFLAYSLPGRDGAAASAQGIATGRRKTARGYLLEALIPWQAMGFTGVPEGEFGIDFQLDFASPGRGRTLQMGAGTATNEAWISSEHYLKARLAK